MKRQRGLTIDEAQRQVGDGNECFSSIAAEAWTVRRVDGDLWFEHPDAGSFEATVADVINFCQIIDGDATT